MADNKINRISLVYLKNPNKNIYDKTGYNSEHLGICYISAALRDAGYTVEIIDGAAENISGDEVYQEILLSDPNVLGFSVTFATINEVLEISKKFKSIKPDIHICLGGHHASFYAKEILDNEPFIDSIIRGDGEETIVELIEALQKNNELSNIRGVYYRDNGGEIIKNNDRPVPTNLDTIKYPSRDILISGIKDNEIRSAMLSSSRGCPYSCKFCSTPGFYKFQNGAYWRARSGSNVVEEINQLHHQYGISNFNFVDDNLVINTPESKLRLGEIINGINKLKIEPSIYIICGVSVFNSNDEQLLIDMRKAGVDRIFLGIEAGNSKSLKLFNKPATTNKNIKGVEYLSKFGFELLCSTILFHPYTSIDELKDNSNFIKQLMDKPNVGMFAPYCRKFEAYKGTDIFSKLESDGLLLSEKMYLDAYAYKFIDPEVQLLSDFMWLLLPDVVDSDWLIWDIRWLSLKMKEQKVHDLNVFSEINRSINKSSHLISKLNKWNFDFFQYAIECTLTNNRKRLEQEKDKYLDILEIHTIGLRKKLSNLYELSRAIQEG